ncbi:MAG TPA: TIM barrel protein, partial [Limnochordia bacterium]|nr:TIM barrel protein [Limnochordia bacterium]
LAEKVAAMGLDGVELPVRSGYPVNPENMLTELPKAARTFERYGLRIFSVAGNDDEATAAACGAAGVPIIRVCKGIDLKRGYFASVEAIRSHWRALAPALAKHHVAIGLQNHCDRQIGSAVGLMQAIEGLDPKHFTAVLDLAHCALDGEPDLMAIDIAWSRLGMVNLKNGVRRRKAGSSPAEWTVDWVLGDEGFASWPVIVRELVRRGYNGPICLTAEYRDEAHGHIEGAATDPRIAHDIAFVKRLLAEAEAGAAGAAAGAGGAG